MTNYYLRQQLDSAIEEINSGSCSVAKGILEPLIRLLVPEAIYLYSTFSVADSESDADFEMRSVSLLNDAAMLGYAPAMYALGTHYESGDVIDRDMNRAEILFSSAAAQGHMRSKFRYGLILLDDQRENSRDKAKSLIREAAEGGVEDAADFLKELEQ
ncbi:tetratricopeptide repeat protein [Lysobacter gummosus]|uniref:SEL1-like repeat protein n=1 Tax=Lysobacter gummosus TaxID=262324 RepID=A0ABY3X9M8_9GAMM|nr:SEL1-like repeat protein [Lysobacter gummosus]UNP29294.1 SEL1-like repeat protein [Lysobacter gummosus]